MRTIKFRGWDGGMFYNIVVDGDLWTANIVEDFWHGGNVMQFIGTFDKNKKEVYEGDIVWVKGRKRFGDYKTQIVYSGCGFKLKENNTYLNDFYLPSNLIEVIGNIYENPELLTQ